MATERLVIVVDERGARVVRRNLEDVGKSARGAGGGVQLLRRALGALGAAVTIKQVVGLANEFQTLENRVKVALGGQGDYNETLQDLFDIANRTRGPVSELVELYQRATIASGELGASQEEMLQFVETVGKALAIQGGSAAESAGALRQLSQSLGSGIVRAEEFNSILEGAFPIALAAARGLDAAGGSVARLRQLVVEGKVTSEEFFNAIMSQSEELAAQFNQSNLTIGQSFTLLRNELLRAVGGFSQATGIGNLLADTIKSLAQFVRDIAPAVNTFGRAITGALGPQDEMTSGAQLLASALVVLTFAFTQLANVLKDTIGAAFESVGRQLGGLAAAAVQLVKGNFSQAGDIISESFGDTKDIVVRSFTELNNELVTSASDTIEKVVQIWDKGARLSEETRRMIFEFDPVDEESGGGGPTPIQELDKDMQRLLETQTEELVMLRMQQAALEAVSGTTRDYNEALEDMQTRAIGARLGNAALAEEIIRSRAEVRRLVEENQAYNDLIEEGRALTESLLDPYERYSATLLRVQELFNAGAISATTFARAQEQASKQLAEDLGLDGAEEALKTFLTRARENAQDILGKGLADAFTGGIKEMPRVFSQVLLELASQFLASEIFRLLSNIGKGGGGGGFLGAVGAFFAGNFARGGQFTVPGSGGPDSVPALMNLSPRETVTITPPGGTPPAAPDTMAAPVVNVPAPMVVVVDDPKKVPAAIQSSEGKRAVIELVRDNASAFRQALGVGG